ncbi:hypothetical protein RJ641_019858 [Dillenia turbinata]|uniref:Uncharacterized protein n=1 Tax=Dillenia turbinata TaxID=194707 RepID=A0AAN8UNY9_9MAGN
MSSKTLACRGVSMIDRLFRPLIRQASESNTSCLISRGFEISSPQLFPSLSQMAELWFTSTFLVCLDSPQPPAAHALIPKDQDVTSVTSWINPKVTTLTQWMLPRLWMPFSATKQTPELLWHINSSALLSFQFDKAPED